MMQMQTQGYGVKLSPTSRIEHQLAEAIKPSSFRDNDSFRAFCDELIKAHRAIQPAQEPGRLFSYLLREIGNGGSHIITTGWGGVVVRDYTHPDVNKYLVIKGGKYLAFEEHAEKTDTIEMTQGRAAFLVCKKGSRDVELRIIEPGFSTTLNPGDKHCLIALENSVVFENSTDPKGMDKDLIFHFTPA